MYTLVRLAKGIETSENAYGAVKTASCGGLLVATESGNAQSQPLEVGLVEVRAKPVEEYLRAIGDELPVYRDTGLAPPLFGTAAALGLLLKTLDLPPGAIHSLQELETLTPITLGQDLRAVATLERPRQRGGLKFITAASQLKTADHVPALSGKTTVLVSDGPAAPAEREGRQKGQTATAQPSDLPVVSRSITQEQLTSYAAASGDDNPLHLDEEFAAGTRFGGIIAHGMLTLAFISEMMTAALGARWLSTGSLRVRFKGAAYLGETVETWGRVEKSTPELESFAVGMSNQATGEDLITGTATVK